MENRNGLSVDFRVAPTTGQAERDALELKRLRRRGYTPWTVAGDRVLRRGLPVASRRLGDSPIPRDIGQRAGSIAGPLLDRNAGYKVSPVIRRRIEESSAGQRPSVAFDACD